MSLPIVLATGGTALVLYSLLSGKKMVVGNSGPMVVKSVGNGGYMRPDAADAFNAMAADAALEGVTLIAGSAFRSVPEQTLLYLAYAARFFAAPTVAKPGTSNHGNGTAVDVATSPTVSLTYASAGYRWMMANAINYGFSWDEGRKVDEPWHWRFIG